MKIVYLFSRNKKIGSKIISYGTSFLEPSIKNTPSHTAILMNNKRVFESTLETGVRIISYKKWLEVNEEVAKIPCTKERSVEEVFEYFKSIKHKKYDYMGVLYFSLKLLLFLLFNKKMPKKNKWNNKNKYFCSEIVGKLTNIDCQMIAPVTLLNIINNNTKPVST